MSELSMIWQMKKEAERDFNKFVKDYKRLEEENRKLKSREEKLLAYYKWYVDKEHNLTEVEDIITENIKLKEKVKELEERLDNKEKLNKSYREEIDKLKIDLKLYENAYWHMFE